MEDNGNTMESGKSTGAVRCIAAFIVTAVALVALFFMAVNTGSISVTPDQLFAGLFITYDENVSIIWDLRFPRIFIALIGGAALAVSGTLLQAAIRNPLADPGIIGISSGASFAAVVVTAFFPALFYATPLIAFAGGLVAFALVYGLAWDTPSRGRFSRKTASGKGGRIPTGSLSPLRIILVGVAVSALFTGLSQAFSALGGTGSSASDIVDANISMKTWSDFTTIAIYGITGLVLSLFTCKRCDLLMLEDKTARSLGINVSLNRICISAIAVLLASITTAIVGPISFLGLIVPHIARLIVGSTHKVLLPYAMLLGAFCLLGADTLGRVIIAPLEISPAIVMAVIGGPAFIVLLKGAGGTYA